MKNNKMNQRGMSISIVLLVIFTLVIIGTCIFYFIIHQRDTAITLQGASSLDSVYIRENLLNFYLENIFEKVTKDFKYGDGVGVFISKFKSSLNDYKDSSGNYIVDDLRQVGWQINESNIELSGDKLILTLNLYLENDNVQGIVVKYAYKKVLIKNLVSGGIETSSTLSDISSEIVPPESADATINTPNQNLNGALEFQDGTREANIYYKYENGWSWSFQYNVDPKYITWHSVDNNFYKSSGMNLKNQKFIESLRGKTCNEGLNLLIDRALKNDEGGWFSNTALVYYGPQKSGQVILSNKYIDCSNIGNNIK